MLVRVVGKWNPLGTHLYFPETLRRMIAVYFIDFLTCFWEENQRETTRFEARPTCCSFPGNVLLHKAINPSVSQQGIPFGRCEAKGTVATFVDPGFEKLLGEHPART